MKTFWLFRTNLRQLEYYHRYTDLAEFKQKCHDFYLLQGIWFLENDVFDEVVIWRLTPKDASEFEIMFDINGKKFIQRFVHNFDECFCHQSPSVTFFRGGFPEYGKLTKTLPGYFGLSLYCGTGQRVRPQHGGEYSKILVEDDLDLENGAIPFYKTANQQIFKPIKAEQQYDICWPCNFSQINCKGQQFFINEVGKSAHLKQLKILHVGNKPEMGKELCKRHRVSNIEFAGYVSRSELNILLNQSKLGLVTSNQLDGSPRILTEIMATGTPFLISGWTRRLKYYHGGAVAGFPQSGIENRIAEAMRNHARLKRRAMAGLDRLSMDTICKLNLAQWGMS